MRVTAILWKGQYRNDGLERLSNRMLASPRFEDPRIVGEPSNWFLVAEVEVYEPLEGNDDRHATRRAA